MQVSCRCKASGKNAALALDSDRANESRRSEGGLSTAEDIGIAPRAIHSPSAQSREVERSCRRPLSARARFSPAAGEIVALALDSGGPSESAPPEIALSASIPSEQRRRVCAEGNSLAPAQSREVERSCSVFAAARPAAKTLRSLWTPTARMNRDGR